jgi:hypothetical protein
MWWRKLLEYIGTRLQAFGREKLKTRLMTLCASCPRILVALKMHREFWEAGYRVFSLWSFRGETCECGRETCEAAGKHPRASNWQHTPEWDEEQIDAMEAAGHFSSGYGVLCRGLLVVDVDARNGGVASWRKLAEAVPALAGAGLIVETGSGGGSRHLYFRSPSPEVALLQHHPDYPGLDFKTSGFVVGPGSRHKSGARYTVAIGTPDDIAPAPAELVDLLRRPDRHRAEYDGRVVDVSHADIADMLSPIDPDCDYDTWIRIGMAVHHATGGTGFAVWDGWSQTGTKYDARGMDSHWHSFGRCANPVTLGTLVHHAEQAGWKMPVTFTPDDIADTADATPADGLPFDLSGVDLTAPPGFVGDLARWIEDQSRRPRKRLAVAGALTAMGNVAGLRYTDDRDGVTCNLFTFCVAGSRTGKEAIQQAVATIHRAAGLAGATHGAIKSEQEIVRNLTRHQAALYVIDEIGIFLQKVKNAQRTGGAAYLDGVIGMLMAAYSKADGFMLLTGDAKDDLRAVLTKEAAQVQKRIDDGDPAAWLHKRLAQVTSALDGLDNGLERPFLSLIGFTTPVTFDELVDYQSATNGFIGRALMFNERETAPRSKRGFRRADMSDRMAATLSQIFTAGEYDATAASGRVEYYGKRTRVPTEARANDMLDAALDWFEDQAEAHKGRTGLEALFLGAYELVSKVSLVLACPEGRRTTEHVRWAFALVRRDLEEKARLVTANDREKDAPKMALQARIANIIDGDGETLGVILNRLRKHKRQDVQAALDKMVSDGIVICEEVNANGRGRSSKLFKLAQI